MAEQAFKGTALEGRERKFTVINENDVEKYSSEPWISKMNSALDDVLFDIERGRKKDGKEPFNSYLVINLDEPYADEIIEVLKRHGHWG